MVDRQSRFAVAFARSARSRFRRPAEGKKPSSFTSGSSGEPKGVVLSHRNIIGNVSQFSVMLDAGPDDMIFASLPFFHSFGATVTLWYPLIHGVPIVTYPNPLESAKIAALVKRHRVTVMLATPTFLRGHLRKTEPLQLRSLGSSSRVRRKLPLDLASSFRNASACAFSRAMD